MEACHYVLYDVYINVLLLQIYKSKERTGSIFTCDVKRVKKGSLDSFEVLELPGYQG